MLRECRGCAEGVPRVWNEDRLKFEEAQAEVLQLYRQLETIWD